VAHQITCYHNVVTLRLDVRGSAVALAQDLRLCIDKITQQGDKATVVLDLTFVQAIPPDVKAMLYRAFQHHTIAQVGICGITPDLVGKFQEWLSPLQATCKVVVDPTEVTVRIALGLSAPAEPQRKLSGLLAHLNKV
jgi:hypothetical protein